MTVTAPSLIVVSNRLPFVINKKEDGTLCRKSSAGGLVTAVAPVVAESKGLWIGWPGHNFAPDLNIPESDPADRTPVSGLKSKQIVPVHLSENEFELYYNGCCNAIFWPLFHSMPDKAVFLKEYWTAYKGVNDKFAEAILATLRGMDKVEGQVPLIWIHDYHLMLAATKVREIAEQENLPCNIGFFLHIPFPAWDMFRILPGHEAVLNGILSCDVVGFHIKDYCINFLDSCQRVFGDQVDTDSMLVHRENRTIRIKALPISIPFKRFETMAKTAPATTWNKLGIQMILGVDRLDYTKGILNRLKAFDTLLSSHPELVEKVMLLQVAVPSRTDVKEYILLKNELDTLVGSIVGKYSTANWSPIRYKYGCLDQDELAGYYRDADIGLVTPFRDGMNLVAKEFVACRVDKPGVLLLSPFAGAGGTMKEALLVNPYETENISEGLYKALKMGEEERKTRMTALRDRERINDVDHWMETFLDVVKEIGEEHGQNIEKNQFIENKMQPIELNN